MKKVKKQYQAAVEKAIELVESKQEALRIVEQCVYEDCGDSIYEKEDV